MTILKSPVLLPGVLVLALGLMSVCLALAQLSFTYAQGTATDQPGIHLHDCALPEITGRAYVYATFEMGPFNPINCVNGIPEWLPASSPQPPPIPEDQQTIPVHQRTNPARFLQVVTLGQKTGDDFVPAVRFGLAHDGRAAQSQLHVTPWLFDGTIDYYAGYARPNTPIDFKMQLGLAGQRMRVWVSERGDDDWFMLAERAPLMNPVTAINHVQVEQYPDGPAIRDLRVQSRPWASRELVQPHPLAKTDRVVGPGKGFTFQSLRSTWRKPGKHVTIFRKPGVHAGFPDVVQAGPRHLVCTWRDGSHTGGTGGLSVAHSYDLGRTWTEPVVVYAERVNCPRIQRLKDGTLLLLTDLAKSPDFPVLFWDSHDGGETWVNERRLDPVAAGGNGMCVPSRVFELPDGSWLITGAWWSKSETIRAEFYRSTDRGQTWEFWSQLLAYPPYGTDELNIVGLPDGRLLVFTRGNRNDAMAVIKAFSSDNGKTWETQEVPFPVTGRICADLLSDGRVMVTYRSGIGRAALRAWIGDPLDPTEFQPTGGHFNDRQTVGLKDGALHIDNDGVCGQFTRYDMRPADSTNSTIDVTAEVKVVRNDRHAATLSVPYVGKFRLFPDHVEMAHDPSIRFEVTPGQFHVYRVVRKPGQIQVYIDGEVALEMASGAPGGYGLGFGNEQRGAWTTDAEVNGSQPDVYQRHINADVTGYSIWRRVEETLDDPTTGRREISWVAARDGFPDQHQLDHIIEIDATVSGHEQGYSGWIELDDGRIFVVHYTCDTAPATGRPDRFIMGISWIRGTFLSPSDLPPVGAQ